MKEYTTKELKQIMAGTEDASDSNVFDPNSGRAKNSKFRRDLNRFVGNDLTEKDLDDLFDSVILGGEENYMYNWWKDKSHQILHRLLCRLTRAEHPEILDDTKKG